MLQFGAVGEYIMGRVTNSDPPVILETLAANLEFPGPPLGWQRTGTLQIVHVRLGS